MLKYPSERRRMRAAAACDVICIPTASWGTFSEYLRSSQLRILHLLTKNNNKKTATTQRQKR